MSDDTLITGLSPQPSPSTTLSIVAALIDIPQENIWRAKQKSKCTRKHATVDRGLLSALHARDLYHHGVGKRLSLEDAQCAVGHREPGTTKLDDRRGYNPEKSASFFATY
jgi:hypothetical protein